MANPNRRRAAMSLLKSLAEAERKARGAALPSGGESIRIECGPSGVMSFSAGGAMLTVPDAERQEVNWTDAFVEFFGDDPEGTEAGMERWGDSPEMAAIGGEFHKAMEVLFMKVAWTVAESGGEVSPELMEYANQRHRGACRRHEMKRAMLLIHGDDENRRRRGEQFRDAKIRKSVERNLALVKSVGGERTEAA